MIDKLHIQDNQTGFDDFTYYLLKMKLFILVTKNHTKLLESDESLGSWEFIANLYPFIESFVSKNVLSNEMRDNVLNYLNVVRFMDEDKTLSISEYIEKIMKIDLINKMIVMINGQEKDNSMRYYRYEMYNRTNDKIYLNPIIMSDEDILEEKEELFDSIAFDHFVLCTHDEGITDEEFDNNYLPKLLDEKMYYEVLNAIYHEYPEKFLNDVFYQRCLQVLNTNLENNKGIYKKNIQEFIDMVSDTREKLTLRKVLK